MIDCVMCGLSVDVTRWGAVQTAGGYWAHRVCVEKLAFDIRETRNKKPDGGSA